MIPSEQPKRVRPEGSSGWWRSARRWWYHFEWPVVGALPEHLKESNRQQADDIGVKLKAVGCGVAPLIDWDAPLFAFEADEIERLARLEHDRWMTARLEEGWRYGPKKDDDAKTHPCLRPYDQLPLHEQDKDRHAVRQVPHRLAQVGFRVYRLKTRPLPC